MALLPPPDIGAAYVDDEKRPSKDFYNWIRSVYDYARGITGGGAAVGGSDRQVQYNAAGTLAGAPITSITATGALSVGPVAGLVPTDNFPSGGTAASARIATMLGSAGTPDTTTDPANIFEKYGTGRTTVSPTIAVGAFKTGNGSNITCQGIFSEAEDKGGWNGSGGNSFIEGTRSQATLATGTVLGSAYGVVAVAGDSGSATHSYLVGMESEIDNNSVNATASFNSLAYAASYVATNNGTKISDAAFILNPFSAKQYIWGLYVPDAAVDPSGAAVRTQHTLIDANGSSVFGSAALATSVTDGFMYIPTMAGTPTGVPTSHTGTVPVVFDTSGLLLWAYTGGAWKKAGPFV